MPRPGGGRTPSALSPVVLGLVALGGGIGAVLRHALTLAVAGHSVAVILVINIVGSGVLGGLSARLGRPDAPFWLRPLFGVGLLGGFTTFSSVMADAAAAGPAGGAVQILAQVVTCVPAAALGHGLVARGRPVGEGR